MSRTYHHAIKSFIQRSRQSVNERALIELHHKLNVTVIILYRLVKVSRSLYIKNHTHKCTMTLCTYMCYYLAHCDHHGFYYKRTQFKSNTVHGGLVMHKVLVTHELCMSLIPGLQNRLSLMIWQQY